MWQGVCLRDDLVQGTSSAHSSKTLSECRSGLRIDSGWATDPVIEIQIEVKALGLHILGPDANWECGMSGGSQGQAKGC